jgi:hypothetical protein
MIVAGLKHSFWLKICSLCLKLLNVLCVYGSQDSVSSVATMLQAGRSGVQIPVGTRHVSLL